MFSLIFSQDQTIDKLNTIDIVMIYLDTFTILQKINFTNFSLVR